MRSAMTNLAIKGRESPKGIKYPRYEGWERDHADMGTKFICKYSGKFIPLDKWIETLHGLPRETGYRARCNGRYSDSFVWCDH